MNFILNFILTSKKHVDNYENKGKIAIRPEEARKELSPNLGNITKEKKYIKF